MLRTQTQYFFLAVIPVAAATMTPFPLLAVLCLLKLREFYDRRYGSAVDNGNELDAVADDEKGSNKHSRPIYCPVMDLRQSDSSQKLIKAAIAQAAKDEEDDDDVEGGANPNGETRGMLGNGNGAGPTMA